MSTSKTEKGSPPVEKSQQESSHRTFSEFLDCVRNFSVDERRAALKGPNAWMAEPVDPCPELFTVEGKEPLKYIWDHLEEFMKRGRKEIQAHVAEYVANKDNSEIIANAVWSCILEHGDEPESDNSRVEQTELLPTKESEDLEMEKTTTNRAKELDPAEQPVTLEDIEAALDTSDRKKAVELWQIRQRALGKPTTHTALYDRVGEHKSDFYKWLKGNKPKGYSTDRALKGVLTTDWK